MKKIEKRWPAAISRAGERSVADVDLPDRADLTIGLPAAQ